MLFDTPEVICIEGISVAAPEDEDVEVTPGVVTYPAIAAPYISKRNEGASIMSIEERSTNANKRIEAAERQKRQREQMERDAQKRKDRWRHRIIGEVVARYFPPVRDFEPGTDEENFDQPKLLEAFLYELSIDPDLVDELQDRAAQRVSEDPDGEWRIST